MVVLGLTSEVIIIWPKIIIYIGYEISTAKETSNRLNILRKTSRVFAKA